MDREQVERLCAGVAKAQDAMGHVGEALASATTALSTFGTMYAEAVETELARRRMLREARRA
jgi:hypothetical protein